MRRILWVILGIVLVFACLLATDFFRVLAGQLSPFERLTTGRNTPSLALKLDPNACIDIPPSPNYLRTESEQDAIAAINNARQQENVRPLQLPSNFALLAPTQQQFVLLNAERTDRNLPPLHLDSYLSQMAQAYSKQMVDLNFFAHTSPIGGTFENRFDDSPGLRYHFKVIAENLAGNPVPAAGAMYEYMYDDSIEACGHRHNILDQDLTTVGIGMMVGSQYGTISAQEFLASSPTNPYQGATPDTEAPHITIQTNVTGSSLHCQAIVNDNVGVVRITWFLDSLGNRLSVGEAFDLNLQSLSPGQHTLLAYAVDGQQNYAMAQQKI